MRLRKMNDIDLLSKIAIFSIFMLVSMFSLFVFSPVCVTNAEDEAPQDEEPYVNSGFVNESMNSFIDKLEFDLTPTSVGVFDSKRVMLYAYTDSSGGCESYISTSGADTSLKNTDTNLNAAILSDFSGELKSNELPMNEWAFSFDRTNFSAVPPVNEPKLIKNVNTWPSETDKYFTEATFGVKVDSTLPSGSYTQDLVYTVIAHPPRGARVSWNLKNGTGSNEEYPSTVEYGEKIDLLKLTPTRKDFTFMGWTNGTQTFTGAETEVDINPGNLGDIEMKALWYHPVEGLHTISNMQDMTGTVCNKTTTPNIYATEIDWDGSHYGDDDYVPRTSLKDTRDGKYYLVSKYADGYCRMVQNLDFELKEGETFLATYNNGTTFETVAGATTQTEDGVAWEQGGDFWHSFRPSGNYSYFQKGYIPSSEPSGEGVEYDWEKTGTLYSFRAATAGTGSGKLHGSASLCPKGWALPQYDWPQNGWYGRMLYYTYQNAYPEGAKETRMPLNEDPFNFTMAGIYEDNAGTYEQQGLSGSYWTLSRTYAEQGAWVLWLTKMTEDPKGWVGYMPWSGGDSGRGFSVRCYAV